MRNVRRAVAKVRKVANFQWDFNEAAAPGLRADAANQERSWRGQAARRKDLSSPPSDSSQTISPVPTQCR
jgi:hypothetical protein